MLLLVVATDLNNVTFYDYDEAEERDLLLEDYFKNKIENYKKQDRLAKGKLAKIIILM
jgi:hypothetical protein